jgi:tetratricopeptide (TPR) repeat protein
VPSRLLRAHHLALLTVVLGLMLAAGGARAQAPQLSTDDEVARGLFQAGKASYEAGRYEEALRFFEQSHARSGRPELLFNIGQVADRLRQDEKALQAFRGFLAQRPQAANRAEVESRIAALERAEAARAAAPADAAGSASSSESAEPAGIPTPAQTAEQANDADDQAFTRSDEGSGVTGRWWFWTGIGAAVAGGVVIALLLSADEPGRAAPYQGNGTSLTGP